MLRGDLVWSTFEPRFHSLGRQDAANTSQLQRRSAFFISSFHSLVMSPPARAETVLAYHSQHRHSRGGGMKHIQCRASSWVMSGWMLG